MLPVPHRGENESMPTDVIMPQMGESIFEGTITRWLKKPGDAVQKDEPLFEISTDKVDAEIPSPVAGILHEIKVPEGSTVQVNTVVAVLAENNPAAGRSAAQKVAAKPQSAPPQVVVMPQMGESIFEGTITKWLKKAGDAVEKDEPLFEISTDKVDAEIPSPLAGILTEIKVPEGATVQVNTVVAVIGGTSSEKVQVPSAFSSSSTTTAPGPSTQMAAKPQSAPPQVAQSPALEVPVRSSPLVRRIAKEHNVDLHQVPGTGSNGRINKDDILRYLSQSSAAKPQSPAPEVPPLQRCRAAQQDARHHRRAHAGEQARQSSRLLCLQGGHDPHRPAPRAGARRLRTAPRRQADFHALHRHRRRAGLAQFSDSQRIAPRQ